MAIAPPFGFTFVASASNACKNKSATEAKASFTSKRSISSDDASAILVDEIMLSFL